jgi:hypothetical protein
MKSVGVYKGNTIRMGRREKYFYVFQFSKEIINRKYKEEV